MSTRLASKNRFTPKISSSKQTEASQSNDAQEPTNPPSNSQIDSTQHSTNNDLTMISSQLVNPSQTSQINSQPTSNAPKKTLGARGKFAPKVSRPTSSIANNTPATEIIDLEPTSSQKTLLGEHMDSLTIESFFNDEDTNEADADLIMDDFFGADEQVSSSSSNLRLPSSGVKEPINSIPTQIPSFNTPSEVPDLQSSSATVQTPSQPSNSTPKPKTLGNRGKFAPKIASRQNNPSATPTVNSSTSVSSAAADPVPIVISSETPTVSVDKNAKKSIGNRGKFAPRSIVSAAVALSSSTQSSDNNPSTSREEQTTAQQNEGSSRRVRFDEAVQFEDYPADPYEMDLDFQTFHQPSSPDNTNSSLLDIETDDNGVPIIASSSGSSSSSLKSASKSQPEFAVNEWGVPIIASSAPAAELFDPEPNVEIWSSSGTSNNAANTVTPETDYDHFSMDIPEEEIPNVPLYVLINSRFESGRKSKKTIEYEEKMEQKKQERNRKRSRSASILSDIEESLAEVTGKGKDGPGSKSRSRSQTPMVEQQQEEREEPQPKQIAAPRIMIDEHGNIRMDKDSLVIDETEVVGDAGDEADLENVEEDSTRYITSASFRKKRPRGSKWTTDQTELFLKGLSWFGTDFGMLAFLFPGRTRHQMKLKFHAEDRKSSSTVTRFLNNRVPPPPEIEESMQEELTRITALQEGDEETEELPVIEEEPIKMDDAIPEPDFDAEVPNVGGSNFLPEPMLDIDDFVEEKDGISEKDADEDMEIAEVRRDKGKQKAEVSAPPPPVIEESQPPPVATIVRSSASVGSSSGKARVVGRFQPKAAPRRVTNLEDGTNEGSRTE